MAPASRTARRRSASIVGGQLKIEALLAFLFGIVFVSAILYFAVTVVNPSSFQIQTFKTVLALAGGGVAAMIPGQFQFRHMPFVRASGAIAVFALIFLAPSHVVSSVSKTVTPTQRPDSTIKKFLSEVDAGNLGVAWNLMDPSGPAWYKINLDDFDQLYKNVRRPLGKILSRTMTTRGGQENPEGYPPGVYRHIMYSSRFSGTDGCLSEIVVVRATSDVEWKVFSYQINLSPTPCLKEGPVETGSL